MARKQRWRAVRAEQRGYAVAVIRDTEREEDVRVYFRFGRWRYYRDDAPVSNRALAATAKRCLESDDAQGRLI